MNGESIQRSRHKLEFEMNKKVSVITRKQVDGTLAEYSGRRDFLAGLAAAAAGAGLVGGIGSPAHADVLGPLVDKKRFATAFKVRANAAAAEARKAKSVEHKDNGDEALYANKIGSFTKGLTHNQLGEVDPAAYASLLKAIKSGKSSDFEAIAMAGPAKLTSPQAAYAFCLEGFDPQTYSVPGAPAFSSALEAAEMAEVYWMALARDVPFVSYGSDPIINQAISSLSALSDFNGPKGGSDVAFRGILPGDTVGPYLSQFLWQDIPFGSITLAQKSNVPVVGIDHMTDFTEFLNIQNGGTPNVARRIDPVPRYLRSLRDVGQYVHIDFAQQEVLTAALILLSYGNDALNPGNPYLGYAKQDRFATFGGPGLVDLAVRVPVPALRATWFQKWCVHRRLRPEEFAGRVHVHRTGGAKYPIDSAFLTSQLLDLVFAKYNSYLLPMGYAEGCPLHPAYTAGHATFTGASATVLKALFNENFVIPNPVQASADGLTLTPYTGAAALTVGGELNKMASNVALARNAMGVHWRTDAIEGIKLGEAMAIAILQDYKNVFNEGFSATFTNFDGKSVAI